jgi:hypothetical protein
MGVDNKSEPFETANGVNARGTNVSLTIFGIPHLKVATASLWAASPELEFRGPFRLGGASQLYQHTHRGPDRKTDNKKGEMKGVRSK